MRRSSARRTLSGLDSAPVRILLAEALTQLGGGGLDLVLLERSLPRRPCRRARIDGA